MLSSKFMSRLNASIFLAIFILSLIASSCEDSTHDTVKDKIVGEWIWIETISGWTGKTITPDSLDLYRTVVFEKDGTYREFQVSSDIDTVVNSR